MTGLPAGASNATTERADAWPLVGGRRKPSKQLTATVHVPVSPNAPSREVREVVLGRNDEYLAYIRTYAGKDATVEYIHKGDAGTPEFVVTYRSEETLQMAMDLISDLLKETKDELDELCSLEERRGNGWAHSSSLQSDAADDHRAKKPAAGRPESHAGAHEQAERSEKPPAFSYAYVVAKAAELAKEATKRRRGKNAAGDGQEDTVLTLAAATADPAAHGREHLCRGGQQPADPVVAKAACAEERAQGPPLATAAALKDGLHGLCPVEDGRGDDLSRHAPQQSDAAESRGRAEPASSSAGATAGMAAEAAPSQKPATGDASKVAEATELATAATKRRRSKKAAGDGHEDKVSTPAPAVEPAAQRLEPPTGVVHELTGVAVVEVGPAEKEGHGSPPAIEPAVQEEACSSGRRVLHVKDLKAVEPDEESTQDSAAEDPGRRSLWPKPRPAAAGTSKRKKLKRRASKDSQVAKSASEAARSRGKTCGRWWRCYCRRRAHVN